MSPGPPAARRFDPTAPALRELLACPRCRGELLFEVGGCRCAGCDLRGTLDGRLAFPELLAPYRDSAEGTDDRLLRRKERVKRSSPELYRRIVRLLSPVFYPGLPAEFLDGFDWERDVVLDLGGGSFRRLPGTLNVDLFDYASIDVACPIDALPFRDASVDGIVSIAVLEHVPHPQAVVAEMHRVLKPGGRVYCFVPFLQGIHASPHDYQRYTDRGLDVLFGAFEERRVEVAAGPTSGLLWTLQEWLAQVLSLGSRRLYAFWYALAFGLFPLKYLDLLLHRHPMAKNIASAFAVSARK